MSLDDLLPLIFLAIFVLNVLLRGRRGGAGRRPSRRAPNAPRPTQETPTQEAPPQGAETAPAPPADDPLARRLEEARRRVRQATGGGDAPTTPTSAGPTSAPSPAPSAAPSPQARTPGSTPASTTPTPTPGAPPSLGTPGRGPGVPPGGPTPPTSGPRRPTPTPTSGASLGREGVPASRTARRRPPPSAWGVPPATRSALADAARVRPTREDVARGIVWNVVLGEPASRRLRRRPASRRP